VSAHTQLGGSLELGESSRVSVEFSWRVFSGWLPGVFKHGASWSTGLLFTVARQGVGKEQQTSLTSNSPRAEEKQFSITMMLKL